MRLTLAAALAALPLLVAACGDDEDVVEEQLESPAVQERGDIEAIEGTDPETDVRDLPEAEIEEEIEEAIDPEAELVAPDADLAEEGIEAVPAEDAEPDAIVIVPDDEADWVLPE